MKKPIKNCYAAIDEDFYFIEGNREVRDEKHVRNIMNAMLQGEFIPPIIVDEKTRLVIDGQHRYTAAVNLWKQKIAYPIVVIESEFENPLLAAITYNNRSKNWRTATYVNAYIADNRESYKLLKEFCLNHSMLHLGEICKYSSAILLLNHVYDTAVVQNGTLVVTAEQCAQAEMLYQELALMREVIPMVMQKHVIHSWINVREAVLEKMSIEKYIALLKRNFVIPASYRLAEWKHALISLV